jgi:hypothetical protein
MSYNTRDDNGLFGPAAGIEINNGAAAPLIARLQIMEPVNYYAAAAANAVTQTCFICPPAASVASGFPPQGTYQVIGASLVFSTASSSGTVQIEKATGTTAPGSGTNMLTGTMSTAGTANTVVNGTVVSNPNTLTLNPGDRLNVVIGGTQTGIVDLCVDVYVIRVS